MKIIVIGAGISGIVASYQLAKKVDLILIEKNQYLGGHTNTQQIDYAEDKGLNIDTGFIVCNRKNYPRFYKFLEELKVPLRDSNMSFGYDCQKSGIQYTGPALSDFFRRPINFLNKSFLKFFFEQQKFNRTLLRELESSSLQDLPLKEKIKELNLSNFFVERYLTPLVASIWSSAGEQVLNFPTKSFALFFKNHGMLEFNKRPKWQTVVGGSHEYIKSFQNNFKGKTITGDPVKSVNFENNRIQVTLESNSQLECDKIIFATHADQSFELLKDKELEVAKELSQWRYSKNEIALHVDSSMMPRSKSVWSSWNYINHEKSAHCATITYYMNMLQGLKSKNDYFVTLNRTDEIERSKIIYKTLYTHPIYTPASLETQSRIVELNGEENIYFCGSYLGHGFHEDGVVSAENVVSKILRSQTL